MTALSGLVLALMLMSAPSASASAGGWQQVEVEGDGFRGVTCDPTADLCAAAGRIGTIATSTDPVGGAAQWHSAKPDGSTEIEGISCPAASLCVAVDAAGNILTASEPTGGAGAWTVQLVHAGFRDVSCASTSLCVALAGDNTLWSTSEPSNPSSWSGTAAIAKSPVQFTNISCAPGTQLCVVSGINNTTFTGEISSSTSPTSGSWSAAAAIGEHEFVSVECASSALCVVGDLKGGVWWSTTPTSAASYSRTQATTGPPVVGLGCASESLCYALDSAGSVFHSNAPAGGSWTGVKVDESANTQARLSCASAAGVCLFSDIEGGFLFVHGATQAISGTITDGQGKALPTVQVNITGTDSHGNPVSVQAFSDIEGNYTASLQPGTYTAAPQPPSAGERFVATSCSGTALAGACGITLDLGEPATASFKLERLLVNSTSVEYDSEAAAAQGICDTTPTQATQTCTLAAAIQVADKLGGATISFDIPEAGTPTITPEASSELPEIFVPVTIDGSTQPGSHTVALISHTAQNGLFLTAAGVTIRGMTIYGFAVNATLGGGDLLTQNQIGTVASPLGRSEEVDVAEVGGANLIQGNTIGGPPPLTRRLLLLELNKPGDTIGGSQAGQGNVLTYGSIALLGAGDVVQGNRITNAGMLVGDNETLGGPTATPGTGAGNDISGGLYGVRLGSGDVLQGNHIHGNDAAGTVLADRDTVGGASPQMGNLLDGNGTTAPTSLDNGAVAVGNPGTIPGAGSGNVVEHNVLINNHGVGAGVYKGVGNTIRDNIMFGDTVGIQLGDSYVYNSSNGYLPENADGPANHLQPYPDILEVALTGSRSTVRIGGQLLMGLLHRHDNYTIDLYSEGHECTRDSITPGQGEVAVATLQIRTDGSGEAHFTTTIPLTQPAGEGGAAGVVVAVTATATSSDGSTSEFGPCLTLGRRAATFAKAGVIPTSRTVAVSNTSAASSRKRKGKSRPKPGPAANAQLSLFCPPLTSRYCAGTVALSGTPHGKPIARGSFKLVPGQVALVRLKLSAAALAKLKHSHRLPSKLLITAHDGARRAHRKRTTVKVTLTG